MPHPASAEDPTVYVLSWTTSTTYTYQLTAAELAAVLGKRVDELPEHPDHIGVMQVEHLLDDLELGALDLADDPVISSDRTWDWDTYPGGLADPAPDDVAGRVTSGGASPAG